MSVMILVVVLFFPEITGPDIQNLFPLQSGIPGVTFQGICRAGLHTTRATAAIASVHRRSTWKLHVDENGSQANPRTEGACDELTMPADPAQPCSCCRRLVRKVAPDVDRIGSSRGCQRLGSKASDFNFNRITKRCFSDNFKGTTWD